MYVSHVTNYLQDQSKKARTSPENTISTSVEAEGDEETEKVDTDEGEGLSLASEYR